MSPFEINATAEAVNLRLNFEVTIEQARALHAALASVLTPAHVLVFDAVALTRIDAAALQVLVAAARCARRAELTAASPVWTAALQRHGITDPFVQP